MMIGTLLWTFLRRWWRDADRCHRKRSMIIALPSSQSSPLKWRWGAPSGKLPSWVQNLSFICTSLQLRIMCDFRSREARATKLLLWMRWALLFVRTIVRLYSWCMHVHLQCNTMLFCERHTIRDEFGAHSSSFRMLQCDSVILIKFCRSPPHPIYAS